MLLLEPAVVGHTGECKRRRRFHLTVERHHGHFVCCDLRVGEGVAPAEVQQLDGRGRRRADEIVGRCEIEMDFGRVVFRAHVRIPAPDGRRRELPPAVIRMPSSDRKAAQVPLRWPVASSPWYRPKNPPRTSISVPWKLKPSRIVTVTAPPSALRPNTGLAPTMVMPSMALSGRKSQLTMSPKDSSMRTPFRRRPALRDAIEGRGVEPTILQVLLEAVALQIFEDRTRHGLLNNARHKRGARALDVGR